MRDGTSELGEDNSENTDLCVGVVRRLETEVLDAHLLEEHPHEA